MKTRISNKFKILFGSNLMSTRILPTYIDLYKHYLSIFNGEKKSSRKNIINMVIQIWNKASLPTFTYCSITNKVDNYLYKADKLNKFINRSSFKEKLENHISNFDKLFDIASCKCTRTCRCQRYSRIPNAENLFLKDQRSTRVMLIGDAICSTYKQSRIAVNNTTDRFNLILV